MADVLVVEAEDLTRRLLVARLADAGHRVRAATSLAHATDLVARSSRPDVLVTDQCLPDGFASELVARLRSAPGSADLPIIVLISGGALTPDVESARIPGAIHLSKPFSTAALTGAVTAVLAPLDAAVEQTVRSRLATFGRLDDYERDLIAELLTTFVQRAPATHAAVERASATGDAEALRSAACRLEAAARNLGANDLGVVCTELAGSCPIPLPLAAHFRRVLGSTCRVFARLAAEFRNEPADAAVVGVARG